MDNPTWLDAGKMIERIVIAGWAFTLLHWQDEKGYTFDIQRDLDLDSPSFTESDADGPTAIQRAYLQWMESLT